MESGRVQTSTIESYVLALPCV